MGAVILNPGWAAGGPGPRVGLVFGAGGVLGAAWMAGALPSLQDRLAGPINDAEVIVGTSAGSVLAAAVRCRATIEEMLAYQRGEGTGPLRDASQLAAQDGPLPPLPHWGVGSPPLLLASLLTPHRVPPLVGASAWLPRGRGHHTTLRATVHALHRQAGPRSAPPRWVDGRTWIVAVDYDSGQRVIFGREGAPVVSLPDAVVASCSIPGWYEPVVIDGRRYVDGGIRSSTSLGLMADAGVDEVYVLAPMASTHADRPHKPHEKLERGLRNLITHRLLRDARALAARGLRVTVLTPGPEDLAVMGINLMDPRRREAVLETSLRTSAAALQEQEHEPQEHGRPRVALPAA